MRPTLIPGQGLLATPYGAAHPGQIRCFQHPRRPGFWLVKRVSRVQGDQMWMVSDNLAIATVDSREFGLIPTAGSYRLVLAIPRHLM